MPCGVLNPEIFGLNANLPSPASSFYWSTNVATGPSLEIMVAGA
jgi:hypothetical protein